MAVGPRGVARVGGFSLEKRAIKSSVAGDRFSATGRARTAGKSPAARIATMFAESMVASDEGGNRGCCRRLS